MEGNVQVCSPFLLCFILVGSPPVVVLRCRVRTAVAASPPRGGTMGRSRNMNVRAETSSKLSNLILRSFALDRLCQSPVSVVWLLNRPSSHHTPTLISKFNYNCLCSHLSTSSTYQSSLPSNCTLLHKHICNSTLSSSFQQTHQQELSQLI